MAGATFPATARLRRPPEFRAVFAAGDKLVCPAFVVIFAPGAHVMARLGLALAKRRISLAVERNRVKRVVRESFRCHREHLGCLDIVVLARSRTDSMNNRMLFDQLGGLWQRMAATQGTSATSRKGDRRA